MTEADVAKLFAAKVKDMNQKPASSVRHRAKLD